MPKLMAADDYEYKSAEDLGYPYGYTRGDATLEGAVYGVYQNGELVKTYTTDKDGYILTDYFPCGDGWTIREITPSEGYLLDDTPQTAEISKPDLPGGRLSRKVFRRV